MGKNSNNKNGFQTMSDLMEEKKKLEKKLGKVMIPCSHTNSNGKLKVDFLGRDLCRCKKCGCEFSFEQIDNDELKSAIRTLHNAINQIKAMSDDPEKESSVIEQLGNLDYNLKEMKELYNKTINDNVRGGKKKKKNRDNNAFGSYGTSNIKFI